MGENKWSDKGRQLFGAWPSRLDTGRLGKTGQQCRGDKGLGQARGRHPPAHCGRLQPSPPAGRLRDKGGRIKPHYIHWLADRKGRSPGWLALASESAQTCHCSTNLQTLLQNKSKYRNPLARYETQQEKCYLEFCRTLEYRITRLTMSTRKCCRITLYSQKLIL